MKEGACFLFILDIYFTLFVCIFFLFGYSVPAEFKIVFDLHNSRASGDGPQFRMDQSGIFQLQKVISIQQKYNFGFCLARN